MKLPIIKPLSTHIADPVSNCVNSEGSMGKISCISLIINDAAIETIDKIDKIMTTDNQLELNSIEP